MIKSSVFTLYLSLLLLILHESHALDPNAPEGFINAAYFQSWSQFNEGKADREVFQPNMIDPALITDLYYAFAIFGFITDSVDPGNARLTHDFTIQPLYANEKAKFYPQIQNLKKRSNGKLRLILSIGGEHFNNPDDPYGVGEKTYPLFSQMVSSRSNRQEFIRSAIAYAHRYGFDGIDIDWEFPGDSRTGGNASDFENFPIFLEECKQAFHSANPPLLLSCAAPAMIPEGVPKQYIDDPDLYYQWLAKCAKFLDRINIMAYNYHTPYNTLKLTGANAPLREDTFSPSKLFIVNTLDNYLKHGIKAKKILLGIPLYGWVYDDVSNLSEQTGPGNPFTKPGDPAMLSYFEIADLIFAKKFVLGSDQKTETAYAYNTKKKQWISFDIPSTVELKAREAKTRGLGGVIFWSIDQDEYQWEPRFPNIRAPLDHKKNRLNVKNSIMW